MWDLEWGGRRYIASMVRKHLDDMRDDPSVPDGWRDVIGRRG